MFPHEVKLVTLLTQFFISSEKILDETKTCKALHRYSEPTPHARSIASDEVNYNGDMQCTEDSVQSTWADLGKMNCQVGPANEDNSSQD